MPAVLEPLLHIKWHKMLTYLQISWYSYNDTKLAQGRDGAKQVVNDNPELADELEGLIFEKLKENKA